MKICIIFSPLTVKSHENKTTFINDLQSSFSFQLTNLLLRKIQKKRRSATGKYLHHRRVKLPGVSKKEIKVPFPGRRK